MNTATLFPRAADEITAEWLTSALRSTGAATGTAAALTVTPVGVGVGLVGALARVAPTWVDGTGPETLIAKFPSPAESSRFVATILNMYRKEVRFYEQLSARSALPHAACLYSAFDEETHDFVLLLSDLAGGRVVDQVSGCNQADAELLIDRLADFHAGFWNDPELVDSGWLGRLADAPFPESIAVSFEQSWGPVVARFGDRMPPAIKALGERFPSLLPELTERLSRPPYTLSHGDYRLDNVFFYVDGEIAVCDWQLVDRSRGARDLAYFLTQSVTPEVRAEREKALVARYVERLQSHGIDDYDLATAWEDYRVATLFSFAYPVVAGGGLDHADERATVLAREILDRCIAAIVDLDCLQLVAS